MLVDNAIVVLENISRLREKGKQPLDAAVVGSRQVGTAITASTLTTIAVFVPVLFMQGMASQTFQQLAWVVSFALFCSLIVALTVVPMLSARFLKAAGEQSRGPLGAVNQGIGGVLDVLSNNYGFVISWALDHRLTVVLTAVTLFSGAYYLSPLIGVELEPEVDEGQIDIDLELAPGTRVDVTNDVVQRIRDLIEKNVPEARYIMTEAGSQSTWRAEGTNNGEIRIDLVDQADRKRSASQVVNELRPLLQIQPGMLVRIRVRSGVRGRGSGFDDAERLSVEVRGHDIGVMQNLAEQVRDAMGSIPGVVNPRISRRPGTPEMLVSVDRAKATSMGLDVSEVADTLETAVGGTRASMYRDEGDEYDIVVRLRQEDRLDLGQVSQIPITLPDGRTIQAESVIRMSRQEGPFEITRADQQRIITVSATIADRDLGSIVGDLQPMLNRHSKTSWIRVAARLRV